MRERNHRLAKAGKGKSQDPESYHAWLVGKGYSPGRAMEMVAKKFGQHEESREPGLGWAWRP